MAGLLLQSHDTQMQQRTAQMEDSDMIGILHVTRYTSKAAMV